jgi:hypothetical protein
MKFKQFIFECIIIMLAGAAFASMFVLVAF